jgi:hypothetical protein
VQQNVPAWSFSAESANGARIASNGLYAFLVGGADLGAPILLRFYAWHLFGLTLPLLFDTAGDCLAQKLIRVTALLPLHIAAEARDFAQECDSGADLQRLERE